MSEFSAASYDNGSSLEESLSGKQLNGHGGKEEGDDDAIKEQLAKKESTAVFRLRVIVVAVLLFTAVAVSIVVYITTHRGETKNFSTQYEAAAQKLFESFEDIVIEMGSISGLGVANSAHSVDHKSDWPFVTLSNFQQRARNARHLSGALFVSVSPIVTEKNLPKWEKYINGDNSYWIKEGFDFQDKLGINNFENDTNIERSSLTSNFVDPLHFFSEIGESILEDGPGPYLPIWQTSPVLKTKLVNSNLLRRRNGTEALVRCIESGSAILGGFIVAPPGYSSHPDPQTAHFASLRSIAEEKQVAYLGDPMAELYFPVYDLFDETKRNVVAVMTSIIHWKTYFTKILPSNINGIIVVLENSCHGYFTYEINGADAHVVGLGDHHDTAFDDWERISSLQLSYLDDGTASGIKFDPGRCQYYLHVYPTKQFYSTYVTRAPIFITLSVATVFLFTVLLFLFYDRLVERRQKIVLAKATKSTAIVSSLFPRNVQERLLEGGKDEDSKNTFAGGHKHRLKTFLNGNLTENENGTQAIADLFPHCTVFFADISGFTAWSSSRDPPQVFHLLQEIYQAFDVIAKRLKVFKVETIGDSYVAVTGLPEAQPHHAIIMAMFARECLQKMNEVVRKLEVSLGPDTGDLSLRLGLHSGPVTAGVLRGDRARFQLFGDTVNTASRMESTGVRGKIQVSESTATLITEAGKNHWLKLREDKVLAKGKGVVTTYWLNPGVRKSGRDSSATGSESANCVSEPETGQRVSEAANSRFVEWMVALLSEYIQKIVFIRQHCGIKENTTPFVYYRPDGMTCIDEVKEVINMPKFNAKAAACMHHDYSIALDESVLEELREYVIAISSLYRDNPFHNFEHACHVTMSVNKLLKRVVAPDLSDHKIENNSKGKKALASHLYDYTHGINSDPLTMLAVNFSALIHDVDHQGISNMQLINESPEIAKKYRSKSVAEQNSLDIAWDILMKEQFNKLRCCLFSSEAELLRFRQIIVNVVLATDIFDKELNDLRKSRWSQAFSGEEKGKNNENDLRATIVIEHIIQASDVSHTMQHWHVYQKWNRSLFEEMQMAYRDGRMSKDPSTFWYEGELGFFDNYIIPLAKKLKECNVFGVSSDEYLNYALLNRAEWEARGKEIIKEMVEAFSPKDKPAASVDN